MRSDQRFQTNDEPRGPTVHATRTRILDAADVRFKTFGYRKTSVDDIAADVGISKAYIYKFFPGKRAIADATTRGHLEGILRDIDHQLAGQKHPGKKLRQFYALLVAHSVRSFFENRQLYEICAVAATERWKSSMEFIAGIEERLAVILNDGRRTGEFERRTRLENQMRAIGRVTAPLLNPLTLQYQLDDADAAIDEVMSLVLRSLAP